LPGCWVLRTMASARISPSTSAMALCGSEVRYAVATVAESRPTSTSRDRKPRNCSRRLTNRRSAGSWMFWPSALDPRNRRRY
jgi:hypothetical protein